MNTQAILRAYIECALWAETDNADPETGGEPLGSNYGASDIAPEALATLRADCERFADRIRAEGLADVVAAHWNDSQLGHDLWLTRNGHGAGFWDRGLPGGGELADICRTLTGRDLYVGDDGKLYIL